MFAALSRMFLSEQAVGIFQGDGYASSGAKIRLCELIARLACVV